MMHFRFMTQRVPGVLSRGDILEISECEDPAGNGLLSVLEIVDPKVGVALLAGDAGYVMQVTIPAAQEPEDDSDTSVTETTHEVPRTLQ